MRILGCIDAHLVRTVLTYTGRPLIVRKCGEGGEVEGRMRTVSEHESDQLVDHTALVGFILFRDDDS